MSVRLEVFGDLLGMLTPGRFLDLATGHGKFALLAHELGWKVTAVDARTARMPMTEGIDWVQADVREFETAGYDAISILGLLYHLELDAQLELLRRCAGTPTIVDTHVSLHADYEEGGYEGHLFDERGGRTDDEHRWSPTASWGNPTAFWATHESLLRMFEDCGFRRVLTLEPWYERDRTFFVCR